MSVAILSKLSISDFMGYLKGKSTLMVYDRHPELQSKRDKSFWARGYYVETIGNITDEAVQKWIRKPYEQMDYLGQRVQVDVKFVPVVWPCKRRQRPAFLSVHCD